jgi:hypothetical protein
MGQIQSADCVNLKDSLSAGNYAKLVDQTYTVVRTSGDEQKGFRIPTKEHWCEKQGTGFCPAAHATRISPSKEPKFFMTTDVILCPNDCAEGHKHNYHVCGWRVCSPKRRTFWPTGMVGDEREAWFKWLDEVITLIPFPTHQDKMKEDSLHMEGCEAAIQQERLTEDDLFYDRAQAAMKNMLKEAAEKVKARTGCQCASVLDCEPCVHGAQGRSLDS